MEVVSVAQRMNEVLLTSPSLFANLMPQAMAQSTPKRC